MSLFPAYNPNDSGNEESSVNTESWLENKSYQKSSRLPKSCSRSPKRSRSRSKSPKRKNRSRSKSPKWKKRSRSRSRDRRRRRSRSRSRHRSRSRSRDRRRKRSKTPKEKHDKITREELIIKHSANKTFLEDIDVAPEHAYSRDNVKDKSLLSVPALPINVTSSYKKYWKRENEELCNFKHIFKPIQNRSKRSKRYYGKDYQLVFNKADLLQTLKNLSSLNKENKLEIRTFYRINQEFLEDVNEACEDNENDIKFHEIQLKTKAFNQKLRQDPYDVDLWIKYVDFQDVAMADSEFMLETSSSKKKSKSSKSASIMVRSKAIVERKLSILKSALDHNPKSVILSVKRLILSKEILDSSTLNRQWKELIYLFPTNVQVWDHFLTFLVSHFTTFTISQITEAFKECFVRLENLVGQALRNDGEDVEEHMSHILIRLWHLWSRAGYREKSVALFQALMEINLRAPVFPGYFSSQDKLATFEPFWESSVPRFGDPNALGWSKFTKEAITEDKLDIGENNEEDEIIAEFGDKVDKVQLWLKLELLRESQHFMPYR